MRGVACLGLLFLGAFIAGLGWFWWETTSLYPVLRLPSCETAWQLMPSETTPGEFILLRHWNITDGFRKEKIICDFPDCLPYTPRLYVNKGTALRVCGSRGQYCQEFCFDTGIGVRVRTVGAWATSVTRHADEGVLTERGECCP